MKRVWLLCQALLPWLAATVAVCSHLGCQSQSPFATIGPATVPAPTTTQNSPYYPPTSPAGSPAATARVASPRLSVSAEDRSAASLPRSTFQADPSDREPIRIVDNPAAATRTATSNNRAAPAMAPAPLVAPPATGNSARPNNRLPAPPSSSSKTSAATFHADPAVVPASFQQPTAATFIETPAPSSQWRAR